MRCQVKRATSVLWHELTLWHEPTLGLNSSSSLSVSVRILPFLLSASRLSLLSPVTCFLDKLRRTYCPVLGDLPGFLVCSLVTIGRIGASLLALPVRGRRSRTRGSEGVGRRPTTICLHLRGLSDHYHPFILHR